MTIDANTAQIFYEHAYATNGINAQRRYPNEELCRFLGKNFFCKTTKNERGNIKILEVGCGSGANLWMLVEEGFDVYGLDFAKEAIELCQQRVGPNAKLRTGNMLDTKYEDNFFDVVLDVFSANTFIHQDYLIFLKETARIIKPGGIFFFFTPCCTSKAFIEHEPAQLLDKYTLNGIYRTDSPYAGNKYPFHFLDAELADRLLGEVGFSRISLNRVTRTHHDLEEPLSHLVGVYKK